MHPYPGRTIAPVPEQPLSLLIGRQLSSVEIVQDYLQLRFDGLCLTEVDDHTRCGNSIPQRGGKDYLNCNIPLFTSSHTQRALNHRRFL